MAKHPASWPINQIPNVHTLPTLQKQLENEDPRVIDEEGHITFFGLIGKDVTDPSNYVILRAYDIVTGQTGSTYIPRKTHENIQHHTNGNLNKHGYFNQAWIFWNEEYVREMSKNDFSIDRYAKLKDNTTFTTVEEREQYAQSEKIYRNLSSFFVSDQGIILINISLLYI